MDRNIEVEKYYTEIERLVDNICNQFSIENEKEDMFQAGVVACLNGLNWSKYDSSDWAHDNVLVHVAAELIKYARKQEAYYNVHEYSSGMKLAYKNWEVYMQNCIILKEAFKLLNKSQQEILYYVYGRELTYAEISEIMQLHSYDIYRIELGAKNILREYFREQGIVPKTNIIY